MDYAALAKKYGGTVATSTAPSAPDLSSIAAKYGGQSASAAPAASAVAPAPEKKEGSALASLAKSLFTAPATIVARPFQAAAELAGASSEDVDRVTKKIPVVGGLIAPVPQNFSDVKKDVGRGAQTVALGLSPIAGGALFGTGASLEQGNDLLSAQTAVDAALGVGGGKVLSWVGKPLLNAAGKVVGTITPKIIQDVAKGGTKAIQDFAASHQLLGGIAAKPAAALERGAQRVDSAIDNTVSTIAGKTGQVLKEQFPGMDLTKHYTGVNEKDILRPTTVNEPKYAKATAVYNDAKNRGIDLEKVASQRKIIHDQLAEGGKYNTADVVDNIREGNYAISDKLARPAIREAQGGVPRVSVIRVRNAMLDKIESIPQNQITAEDRAMMVRQINRRYAAGGAEDLAHPDGYNLEDLHDARISRQKNGKYKIGQSPSAELGAQRSREEARVFNDIFDKAAPEDLGIAPFKKELEKNFLLADYLESLHGKKVPAGITKKAARLFGRAVTATVGGKIGGFPGSILGAQYGDMLFSTFETLPNPVKMKVLQAVKAQDPEIYQELAKYIGAQEAARLGRKALPGPGGTSYKKEPPTLFTTPGGRTSPVKGEAVDMASVESGNAKRPKTDRRLASYLKRQEGAPIPYIPDSELPVIKAGTTPKPKKSPKSLRDIAF